MEKSNKTILSYIPGFRSGKIWRTIVAIVYYILAIYIGRNNFGYFIHMLGLFIIASIGLDMALYVSGKEEDFKSITSIWYLLFAMILIGVAGFFIY